MVRVDTPDDTAWMYGVVAADQSVALMSYVQLDRPRNNQPTAMRIPGLDPRRRYQLSDVTPGGRIEAGFPSAQVSGAALTEIGLAVAPQQVLTATVILVEAR
jgi:alpha-galactosidase